MSDERSGAASSHRRRRPSIFGRGPMGGFGMPVQKAKDFKGTLRRLLGYLRAAPAPRLIVVIVAGVISTLFSIVGPKMLGKATTKLFEGLPGAQMPGARRRHRLRLRRQHADVADRLYVVSAAVPLPAAVPDGGRRAEDRVSRCASEVEAKFSRLPLKFFDSRTHGEILSRAVNDLDNISSTLQQNLTQLITSVLSVIGIIIMMLTISWLLTLVVVLTLPLSVTIVATIAKRSQALLHRASRRRSAS